ncbi:MAG: DNA polymerase III subunit gamma/tau [Desulfovibrionaceae bacterium]|nr:DNA polymerase III subunit gamma/tau [Desulfovibrionaceae bacterium]
MKHTNVLSLKYRPQRFSDVIGQEVACRILSKASVTNAVAPAYILSGTRGVGKTTLARIFAKALLCTHAPTEEPCNECSHCTRISKGQFVDVIELDAASHRSIDDIRDLRENVGFSPMEGRYKIFILDEAHMLTKEAYNALLKTLEEPPPFVVFIFASTDIQKFPATILSRCQQITLKSVPTPTLIEHLSRVLDKENIKYTKDAVEVVARRGFGSVRDSLSLLGQVLVGVQGEITRESVEDMLGLATQDIYISIIDTIISQDTLRIIDISQDILTKGIDIKYFLQELTALCRTLCLAKQHGKQALIRLDIPEEYHNILLKCTDSLSLQHIYMCWQMVLHGQKQVLESIEPSVALELLLLNIVSIRGMVTSKDYIAHTQLHTNDKEEVEQVRTLQKEQSIQEKHNSKNNISSNTATRVTEKKEPTHSEQSISREEHLSSSRKVQEGEQKSIIEDKTHIQQSTSTPSKGFSIRQEMERALRASSLNIEGNPLEYEEETLSPSPYIQDEQSSQPPIQSQSQLSPTEGISYKNKVTTEYGDKDKYPILDIIEEEFNTTHKYVYKDTNK